MEKDNKNEEIVLIKSGDYSMFASLKKDETIIIGDPSSFVYAGVSMTEKQSDTLVKKLKRKINKKRDE